MITKKVENLNNVYASDLPSRAVAVYLYLYQRANKESSCFPAIGTISNELNLSRSTVKRAIGDLVKNGYIIKHERYRESGAQSSNLYILAV